MDGIVYLVTNTINGKKYVGSTSKPLEQRLKQHWTARNKKPYNTYPLYQDIIQFGIEAFNIEPLLSMKFFDKKELLIVEDAYIAIHDTIHNGYNQRYNAYKRMDKDKKRDFNVDYQKKNRENLNKYWREYRKKKKTQQTS